MVGRKDDEWPPGNGSPKTGSSTVMALDPSSAKPRSLGATFLPALTQYYYCYTGGRVGFPTD